MNVDEDKYIQNHKRRQRDISLRLSSPSLLQVGGKVSHVMGRNLGLFLVQITVH